MKQYLELVKDIRDNGSYKEDRTGTGTLSVFGRQMRFDMSNGQFPLVTTKHTHLKSIIHELLWFIQGDTNIRYLKENGVRIWDEWVLPDTAEYRDMDAAEIQVVLVKHFKATDFTPVHVSDMDNPSSYKIERNEADDSWIIFEYGNLASWQNAYIDIIGKEPRVLVAGELGPVYGAQWRAWEDTRVVQGGDELIKLKAEGYEVVGDIQGTAFIDGVGFSNCYVVRKEIDQIANLIHTLKTNPDSRRIIVSAWNPSVVDEQALPPCHSLFQFYTAPLSGTERWRLMGKKGIHISFCTEPSEEELHRIADEHGIPSRRLSCQLYQRK